MLSVRPVPVFIRGPAPQRAAALASLLGALLLAGCARLPPVPPPDPKPVPVLIATPVREVLTPPLQALQDGPHDLQALASFTVLPDGSVSAARLVFSELDPASEAALLSALAHWRFKPAQEGGRAVAQTFIYPLFFGPDARGERTRFLCRNQAEIYAPDSACRIVQVGGWRIYQVDPVYPPALLATRPSGSVTLSFDVSPRGEVQHPKVQRATPPGDFDAAALAAVRQWYFEPLHGDPGKLSRQHVTVTVKIAPPPAKVPPPHPAAAAPSHNPDSSGSLPTKGGRAGGARSKDRAANASQHC